MGLLRGCDGWSPPSTSTGTHQGVLAAVVLLMVAWEGGQGPLKTRLAVHGSDCSPA